MKILLLSDTHGELKKVYQIYKNLTDIDMIFHCGDYKQDAYDLEYRLNVPVAAVWGNSDNCWHEDRQIVETPAGKIILTHGHMEHVQFKLTNLPYLAEENDCIAVCFGHTHKAFCEEVGGIWLINPGSLTDPRDDSDGSYAILQCDEDGFHAEIMYYDKDRDDQPVDIPAGSGDSDSDWLDELLSEFDDLDSGNSGSSKGSGGSSGKKGKKSKTSGGFLRRLLNYSDRF